MKSNLPLFGSLLLFLLVSCTATVTKTDPENAKKEVAKAEADFASMAADKGIAEAFAYFADSNAVIKRQNDTLIYAKEGIRNYYSQPFFQKASVDWSPDFVEVSSSADLAYIMENTIGNRLIPPEPFMNRKVFFIPYGRSKKTAAGNMYGTDPFPFFRTHSKIGKLSNKLGSI